MSKRQNVAWLFVPYVPERKESRKYAKLVFWCVLRVLCSLCLLNLNPVDVLYEVCSFLDVWDHLQFLRASKLAHQLGSNVRSWGPSLDLIKHADNFDSNLALLNNFNPFVALRSLLKVNFRPSRTLLFGFRFEEDGGQGHCHFPRETLWGSEYRRFFGMQVCRALYLRVPCIGSAISILRMLPKETLINLQSLKIDMDGTPHNNHSHCIPVHDGLRQLGQFIPQCKSLDSFQLVLDTMGYSVRGLIPGLAKLPRLERIQLPEPNDAMLLFETKSINLLAKLKRLQRLSIVCHPAHAPALGQLTSLRHLELDFGADDVWGGFGWDGQFDLSALARLTRLETLVLWHLDCAVDVPVNLTWISKLPLRVLIIRDCNIADPIDFTGLNRLEHLSLAGIGVSDARVMLDSFKNSAKTLTRLYFAAIHANLKRDVWPALAQFENLRRLRVWPIRPINDVQLIRQFRNLTHLDLSNNKSLDDSALEALSSLPHLEVLIISGTQVTGEGFERVLNTTQLAFGKLKTLDWDDTQEHGPNEWTGRMLARGIKFEYIAEDNEFDFSFWE